MLNSSFDNSFSTKAARNLKKAILLDLNKPNNFKQKVEAKTHESLWSQENADDPIHRQESDLIMRETARGAEQFDTERNNGMSELIM